MTSIQQKGVSSDRIHGSSPVNVELLECEICRDILWEPIACQICEKPFCSGCMSRWLVNSPTKCPNRCGTYTERKCPPFIANLLAQLRIVCFYKSNGCEEIMSYEALDKHEIECGYQSIQCPGCKAQMLKKDFSIHDNNCELFPLTCKDCKFTYIRNEADIKHTENICLRKQIERVQGELQEKKCEMQKLSHQVTEMRKLITLLTREVITFDDLPSTTQKLTFPLNYKGLQWSKFSYMYELHVVKNFPKSGYVTSFMPGGSLYIAYFSEEATIKNEHPNETFMFVSLNACAAWHDDLQLTITAYRKSIQVNHRGITLLFGRPQRILLQWNDIDKITFKPSGGTPHPGVGDSMGYHVAITQITIDNLAEKKIIS